MIKTKIGLLFTGSIAVSRAKEVKKEFEKHFELIICATNSAKKIYKNEFGKEIYFDLFNANENREVNHIKYFKKCSVIIVYAATYNTINKFANGINDDFILASLSAFTKDIIFVPAMNENMYTSEILQENITKIKNLNKRFHFIDPIVGRLREGNIALGHVANTEDILFFIQSLLFNKKLNGKKIIVASGAMQTKLDKVRVISNLSSSNFAKHLVQHLSNLGANVIWLDNSNKQVRGVNKYIVNTNKETIKQAIKYLDDEMTYISLTAGSDFKLKEIFKEKISSEENITLNLVKEDKILEKIQEKLHNKNIDYIAFKLSSKQEDAYKLLNKCNCSYVIWNDLETINKNLVNGELISYNQNVKLKGSKAKISLEIIKKIFNI